MTRQITRRELLAAGTLGMAATLSMAACGGRPAQESESINQDATDQEAPKEDGASELDESPLALIGAFHSSTGLYEPREFANGTATPEEIAQGTENLQQSEASNDTKTFFVAAELRADERENLDTGAVSSFNTGELHSAARLVIDDINEYNDCYDLNNTNKVYAATLSELGYYDGTYTTTLYGGSEESVRVIFVFLIGNADYENGQQAHLEWGSFSADFPLTEIVEVESPNAIVEQLSS